MVAVVVPCRNEAAHIERLLDALAGQTRRPDEVIIVDDASTDDTVARVRRWTSDQAEARAVHVRVIAGPGRGPGPAVNAGVRATTADIIMRMDGHSVPASDYLERSLNTVRSAECEVRSAECGVRSAELAADSPVGVVGGVWVVRPGADTAEAQAIAAVVSSPLGSGGAAYRTPRGLGSDPVDVETVPFGTFPRALWETLNGFDESLEANQDFDFNYRARKAGWRVVLDPAIRCEYFARPTLGALARQYFRYGFWKVQMLRKDPRALHWRQVPPALIGPWVTGTALLVAGWPVPVSVGLAALYPLIVLVGALGVGLRQGVNPIWAAAALVTVHLAWSAGFWRGVMRP